MGWTSIIVAAPGDEEAVLDALLGLGATAVDLDGSRVFALFATLPDPGRLAALGKVEVREAVTLDWGSTWAPVTRPIRVGNASLVIDAGPAFGTGLHPTTTLVLDGLAERAPVAVLLDVGTGTGVLALAALVLGTLRAVGTDIDADALAVAGANAVRNGLADRLELVRTPAGQFPRIVANILASPLMDLAPSLAGWTAPGGEVLLSGIRRDQRQAVEKAYRRVGFHPIGHAEKDDWVRVDLVASW